MADIAALGFSVGTRELKEATKELKKMPSAAQAAERSAKGMGKSASGAAQKVANDNAKATKSVKGLGSAFNIAKGQVIAFGVAAAAAFASAFAVKNLIEFSDALAEVSTLVEVTTFDMRGLEAAAIDMSRQFGTSGAAQVKAFYSTISAGASSAAEATETLSVANRLAVGGVTDIGTAVTGLTSFMNAYGDEVEGAIGVSDALFVGMRAGQTTIGELAGGLGKVASLAKASGTSFDELVASVSALTKGGVATSEAITGVRAILAGVVKPTSEAAKMAESLGLEFNAAALKAKGFQAFIADVAAKTGGSTDKLAQLFGGVEALVPVLALAGKAGADFADIMEQMADKAGATEAAFDKIAMSAGFQAGRVWSALKAEVLLAGGALLNDMVPALKAVADNMGTLTKLIKVAGVTLLVAFGPAILTGIVNGFIALGIAGVGAIKAITAAMALNPIGAIAIGLTLAITAVWQFRDDIEQAIGVDVVGVFKTAANFIKNSFEFVIFDIGWQFKALVTVIGAAMIGTVNVIIDGLNAAQDVLSKITGTKFEPIKAVDNPYIKMIDDAVAYRKSAFERITAQDMFGSSKPQQATSATSQVSVDPILANVPTPDALNKIGEAAKGAAVQTDKLNTSLDKVDPLLARIKTISDDVGSSIANSFTNAIRSGEKFSDTLKNIALNIAEMAFQQAVTGPLSSALSGGIGSVLGSLFSFDGGGSTGNGPRTGGVDGKGGFPAIMHPQETVTDHTKGGGGQNVQVNVYAPPGSKVEQNDAVGPGGRTIDIIIDEATANNISRPGSRTGQAIQRRFGSGPQLAQR